MNAIRQWERALFKKWRKHVAADENLFFVEDGALDPEAYTDATLKICLFLKEVPFDGTAASGYIFRERFLREVEETGEEEYLENGGTLSILAKRIEVIRYVFEGLPIPEPIQMLRESAYVNIKKYNGKKTSNQKDLENIAQNDKDLLKVQIDDSLNPDIILCGNTKPFLGLIYGENNIKPVMEDAKKRIQLFHLPVDEKQSRLIIEMPHPSHSGSENELLRELKVLLEKYQDSGLCII
jgi:hypothetical protein